MVFKSWQQIVNDYVARLLDFSKPYDPLRPIIVDDTFIHRSLLIAKRMVTLTLQANARSWREAASLSSKGKRIYEAIRREREAGPVAGTYRQLIEENAKLIRSLPLTTAQTITRVVAKEQAQGTRAATIERIFKAQYPTMLASKARLIARTEVSKAESAFTQVRSQALGLNWYEWQTSHDVRVRPSHRNMAGVLVNWSNPPSPEALIHVHSTLGRYNAGNCPNCRCPALPLITVDDVNWPHKVYAGGAIRMMTRNQFLTIQ